jgi:hypothetical protein
MECNGKNKIRDEPFFYVADYYGFVEIKTCKIFKCF